MSAQPMRTLRCPGAPHDPSERECVQRLGEWEVRCFGEHDLRWIYMLRRSMAHLQLWHPGRAVSVLTPSCLTCQAWEIDFATVHRRRLRVEGYEEVEDVLGAHRLPMPPDAELLRVAHRELVTRKLELALLLGGVGTPGRVFPEG